MWYVARHKGVTLTDAETAKLNTAFERILAVNLAEPQVFVHRDYHSRNLMLLDPADGLGANPGIIDFQDAVFGPISYDLVSLFKDAYIHWDEDFILDMLIRYWETARKLGRRCARNSPTSTATSSGWACSATSRCSASSPACATATARTATSPTCRW